MGIKHTKVSAIADDADTSRVQASDWNDDHTIDGDVDFNGFAIVNATGDIGGGVAEIVEDLTPQLGGDLDANGFNIGFDDGTSITDDDGNEQVTFQKTASAVNGITVRNAATGEAPSVEASGDNTNVNLWLKPKGADGQVMVGATGTSVPVDGFVSKFQLVSDATDWGEIQAIYGFHSTTAGYVFAKSRHASPGSHTIVQADDTVGAIYVFGSNGTAYKECAEIRFEIDGTPGAGDDMPGRIVFLTTPDGSGSAVKAVTVKNDGGLILGSSTTSPGAAGIRCANIIASSYVKTLSTTFGALPSAATAGSGARAFVTDCNTATFLATAAAGGANKVPVVSDGTNWLVG